MLNLNFPQIVQLVPLLGIVVSTKAPYEFGRTVHGTLKEHTSFILVGPSFVLQSATSFRHLCTLTDESQYIAE
jgi:hypothetical protein